MIKIYLDDARQCPTNFSLAKNYDECIYLLENNEISVLSLDHDLGEEKTGYDVCKQLIEMFLDSPERWPQEIYLHTDNPVGRDNMFQLLDHYKPEHVKLKRFAYGG